MRNDSFVHRGGRGSVRLATMLVLIAVMVPALAGCGKPDLEFGEGIYVDETVTPDIQEWVEAAGEEFLEHARQEEWSAIWDITTSDIRDVSTPDQFLGTVKQVAGSIGFPDRAETHMISLVRFGPNYPHQNQIDYVAEGEEDVLTMYLPPNDAQATLVQIGQSGSESFFYSTLWFLEAGEWRLATFFAKPATAFGRGWEQYAKQASDERLAGNQRNAALLYNLAIDLVVPAAWVKPAEIDALQRTQKRISVDRLPADRVSTWADTPDTFRVFSVNYNVRPEGLGLLVKYESPVAPADTAGQAGYAEKLHAYSVREFPEYPEVFNTLTLQAFDPQEHRPVWFGTWAWEKSP